MALKAAFALVWTLAVFSALPQSQGEEYRKEIVRKTVSVKSPERVSSVINHFNPAAHVYAAEGNVLIDRTTPAPTTTTTTTPRPVVSLAKKVSVHSPATSFSENKHFDPAFHKYEATGEVIINRESPFLTSQSNIFESHQKSNSNKRRSLNLSKSVSVKSLQRQSSVIDHFSPSAHNYDAIGSVQINRQNQPNQDYLPPKITQERPKYVYEEPKIRFEEGKVQRAPLRKQSTPKLSLQKSVSVKSPERKSTVINHFNPAVHEYTATGNVVINRQSSNQVRTQAFKKPVINVVRATSKVQKPQPQQRTKISRGEGLNLRKSVSVKSPQRPTSVIDHFNPAKHVYEATGDVEISRQSRPSVQRAPQTVYKAPSPKPSKPQVTYLASSSDDRDDTRSKSSFVRSPSSPSANRAASGLSLKKSVSVKSPERKSSVISHFTPADHNYAATGNVVINRQASTKVRTQANKPAVRVTKVKAPVRAPAPAPILTYKAPKQQQPSKSRGNDLNLRKSVSVKSPQRASSVISHFNPAIHVYEATGDVEITRQSSKPSVQRAPQTTYRAPSPKPSKPVATYLVPSSGDSKESSSRSTVRVSPFPSAQKAASGLALKKSVSVKSPERKSSVISHFTPAVHSYAATGNVVINRQASTQVRTQARKPVVNTVRSSNVKATVPSPILTYKAPQAQRRTKVSKGDGLSIRKSVSVKSPQRSTSVIDHFNPAKHIYEATGDVEISRQSRPVAQRTPQTVYKAPSPKPQVTYFAPTSNHSPKQSVSLSPSPSTKQTSAGLKLTKSVSVKSPERKSSVISHFTPADHRYDATGSVVISRASAGPSTISKPTVLSLPQVLEFTSLKAYSAPQKSDDDKPVGKQPEPVQKFDFGPSLSADFSGIASYLPPSHGPKPQSSAQALSLKKSVSVKSPEDRSTVIDHFNPAKHVYEATGEVSINRSL